MGLAMLVLILKSPILQPTSTLLVKLTHLGHSVGEFSLWIIVAPRLQAAAQVLDRRLAHRATASRAIRADLHVVERMRAACDGANDGVAVNEIAPHRPPREERRPVDDRVRRGVGGTPRALF